MDLGDEILGMDDREIRALYVPQWKRTVWLRTLTAREADVFEVSCMGKKNSNDALINARARYAMLVCCNEDGSPLFKAGSEGRLGAKNAGALSLIWDEGRKLNGMTDEEKADMLKNSGADPSDHSFSNSPND